MLDTTPAPPTSAMDVILSLAWSIYIPSFIFGLSDGVILPIVPLYARELTSSDALVGVVLSAGTEQV